MKTTRIAIIGAMEEETREIEQFLTHVEKIEGKAGLAFMEGEYGGLSVIAVRCGIGKVNAALCTQIVLDLYDPELVINVGVAGGIAPGLRVGDVVISDKAQQHDVDTSAFGDPKGVIPRMETSVFQADPELIQLAQKVGHRLGLSVTVGKVIIGDQFIADEGLKKALFQDFGASCTEMEGAAIAHVCAVNQAPFLLIRSISDAAGEQAVISYQDFVTTAAANAAALVRGMLDEKLHGLQP